MSHTHKFTEQDVWCCAGNVSCQGNSTHVTISAVKPEHEKEWLKVKEKKNIHMEESNRSKWEI